jgi:hypothetical protein
LLKFRKKTMERFRVFERMRFIGENWHESVAESGMQIPGWSTTTALSLAFERA